MNDNLVQLVTAEHLDLVFEQVNRQTNTDRDVRQPAACANEQVDLGQGVDARRQGQWTPELHGLDPVLDRPIKELVNLSQGRILILGR